MAHCNKLPMMFLALLAIGLLSSQAYGLAVMSIDIGSEWMKIAIVSPGVPMEIALNKESKRKTPVTISFRDGERTFGEDAQVVGTRFPKNSFSYILDLIGKPIDNPIVQLYKKRFPYYDIEADTERNTIVFRLDKDTTYTPEELLAQLLYKAKEFAQNSAGQKINEAVITVPGYFNQAERLALLQAAELADIKVLQLFNDYSAVALNYGIFHHKEINDTAHYIMFYDMGASSTTATVVGYQNIKTKERGFVETHPQVSILGVGYDRTLGGLEMQLRLRDYLAKEFDAMKKTKNSVFENPRALAKLFKESGRLKNVLSANADHYAQIEGLLDDQDFRLQVTREKFEELCADLFDRVSNPVKTALETSGLTMDIISQVVLVGAGTRVPKVQEKLSAFVKTELSKNINTDEAAALGAVYKAADLSQGFKVKKFITKDAVLFPIQIVFDRTVDDKVKQVRRTLFSKMNAYPQKKIITFNKHNQDFSFEVNYAELDYLPKEEIAAIGNLNISTITLTGVAEALAKHAKEGGESKGIKAHFSMDESGILNLVNVELVSEKTSIAADEEEGAFSKLGSTISKLFSGSNDKEPEKVEEPPKEDIKPVHEEPEYPGLKKEAEEKAKANNDSKPTEEKAENKTEKADKEKKPTIVTIKEPIEAKELKLGPQMLSNDKLATSQEKLQALNAYDKEKAKRESALNNLESFVIDAQQKLESDEYKAAIIAEDAEKIKQACNEVSEWLYEEGFEAPAETYEQKLTDLQKLTGDLYERVFEHRERPEALKGMVSMLNGSRVFLDNMRNLNVSAEIFTQVEIETLEKAINETQEYRDVVVKVTSETKLYEPVVYKVRDIANKMALLDREVKYLVNKAKIWKPKQEATKNNTEETGENKTNSGDSEAETKTSDNKDKAESERDDSETIETEETLELPPSDTTQSEKKESDDEHVEL
ncbi:hypoxia up-regulated protein 1 isoform X1 [Nasonia vitripennis]|uniref:Hypoxia up-regulated protein 1 n=1 Tax=Nasonia vitripennis TaxID=7425 RepID=A0A7M7H442_NASVI|nr:hypoxia up-regulated protein 1 isoform X1 [Nasonia vitripennis]XP_008207115.1 hypoxia up-regulated protein 1 isoform X1 [Nasonia vitripennis]XP_008207116.1 hypoxia up-regulated protein 1 isoform X1 [Nasonia vitripennis]XP_032456173.1 hypoxia up-regulated protein 1 isoform X1 [Nasonia vitripennis]XP_032456174.1 hypoxia up-regulated protein 1 isoform X1 [Nasonia vitripennis]